MLFKHTCYVTVRLLSRKLQLTYTLHVTSCLLGIFSFLKIEKKLLRKITPKFDASVELVGQPHGIGDLSSNFD